MTLTAASWALRAVCLGFWLQSAAAGELAVLKLCKPSQSRPDFGHLELETVPVFKRKNKSPLENLFEFQERNDTSGCFEDEPEKLSKIQFTSQGYLSIEQEKQIGNETSKAFVWYAPQEFCVQVSSEKRLQAVRLLKCKNDDRSAGHPKEPLMVPKCCPPGYAVDFEMWDSVDHNLCILSEERWAPEFYHHESVGGLCVRPTWKEEIPKVRFYSKELDFFKVLTLRPKRPLMEDNGIVEHNRVRWRLLDNGSFVQLDSSKNKWYPHGRWQWNQLAECADLMVNIRGIGNPESVEIFLEDSTAHLPDFDMYFPLDATEAPEDDNVTENTEATTMFETMMNETKFTSEISNNGEPENKNSPQCVWKSVTIIYIVCYFLSAPFLLLTIAVFVLTRKSQSVYGWTMLGHLVSFFLMNVAGGALLWTSSCVRFGKLQNFCTFVGMAYHYLWLSVYVWLTCVNFDLWWTFRKIRAAPTKPSLLRFYIFAAISVGVPLIFVLTGYVLDVTYGEHGYDSDCDIILPNFGIPKCFLAPASEGVYLFYPLLVLLFLNLVFFLWTASKIYSVRSSTKIVRKPTEGIDKDTILMFGKLFIVMGTSCIFEFIAWFAYPKVREEGEEQNLVFVLIDFINYLGRSIAVFLIFVCKKTVRDEARRVLVNWGVLRPTTDGSPASSGATHSSGLSGSAVGDAGGAPSSGGVVQLRSLQTRGK